MEINKIKNVIFSRKRYWKGISGHGWVSGGTYDYRKEITNSNDVTNTYLYGKKSVNFHVKLTPLEPKVASKIDPSNYVNLLL